jgi:hypothetical protein
MTTQSKNLTREEADAFGRELDALRPESPDRASYVPGPPCRALPGDGSARARDLRVVPEEAATPLTYRAAA